MNLPSNLPGGEFSFSIGMSGTSERSGKPAKRYIAQPFEAHVAGKDALVMPLQGGPTTKVPLNQGRLLSLCDRLRTLDQHCREAIRSWSLPANQASAVRQNLERLVDLGLLIDQATVASRITASRPGSAPAADPLNALCIRTCERPGQLENLLAQLARRADRQVTDMLIVLDDSRNPDNIEENAAIIDRTCSGTMRTIHHLTRKRRRALTEYIARAAGCSRDELVSIIEGDPDDNMPSYGAGLNLALLLNAGRRFLMIDDDTDLGVHAIGGEAPAIRLCENQAFRSLFPDPRKSEPEQFPSLNVDPLQSHTEILGRHPDDLGHLPGFEPDRFLGHVSPQMLQELSFTPRIRLTSNGTLGDVGTGSMAWLFVLPASDFKPLVASPESYRQLAYGRRMARCAPQLQIGSLQAFMTTTVSGIDNRELLLPTVARGRGEDMVLAASIRFLYPGALLASLPWMLGHRLDQPRRWEEADLAKGITINPATYLAEKIRALSESELATDPFTRSRFLGASMANLAAMTPEALGMDLCRHIVKYRLGMAGMIAETMQAINPPAWLQSDFETLLYRHSSLDDWDPDRVDTMARAIQRQAALLANGMEAWCKAWQWCANKTGPDLLELVN
ncbi:MAG: hypothetical protein EA370_09705 [Wenzhouxiangella sp.]|nr:MAG: hypothetical protein EA370_09705 [Wenzhouxiangella sp.]